MSGSKIRLLFISLAVFAFYLFRLYSVQADRIQIPDQAQVRVVGRVRNQPYLKDSKQIINVNGFLVRTDRFPTYFYGQKLVVIGKVQKRLINSFQTEFVFNYPAIQVIETGQTLIDKIDFKAWLLKLKDRLERVVEEVLPEPQASLLIGILLGSKREMPEKFSQNLRETGTIHVVVASGYNITVVAGFLVASLVWFLSRKKALAIAFLGIIGYTIMAGAEPPIVRAAIMGSLTYLAQFLGREKDAVAALLFAAIIMLLISPLMLFDIGFQLSFLATAGILLLRIPFVGEGLRVTLAAQIAVLPILLFHFGRVSFLSPLINALVLPVVPLIMGLGAALMAVGLVVQPLAPLVAGLVWVPLTYFVKVIDGFGRLSWFSFGVGELSFGWVVGYYLVLFLWLLRKRKFTLPA